MGKPQQVKEAQLRADYEALSAMGKKGGRIGSSHRIQNEDLRKSEEQRILDERTAELAGTETVKDGEVLPPEPATQEE